MVGDHRTNTGTVVVRSVLGFEKYLATLDSLHFTTLISCSHFGRMFTLTEEINLLRSIYSI